MSESKFINQETIGYLETASGSSLSQKVTALEVNLENVMNYLSEAHDYQDVMEKETARTYEETNLRFLGQGNDIAHLKQVMSNVVASQKKQRRSILLTILVVSLAVTFGAIAWLVK